MEKTLRELKETLEEEIKKIAKKNDITPAELENATKAVCLIEKIKMIERLDMDDADYSEGSYSNARMRMNYSNEYADNSRGRYGSYNDSSYRRGRSTTTGRYMSRDGYDNGYSGHSIKDRMIDRLESMIDEAKTEHEKQTVMEWINRLDSQ